MLYRSTLNCDRTWPKRKILPARKSIWLIRSPSTVPGVTTLIVTLGALPDSGRPSVCATVAVGTERFAARLLPGMLWNVVLTCTSAFGIVYEPRPLICVKKGFSTRQYGFDTPVSGSTALIWQLSVMARPVLEPPWN